MPYHHRWSLFTFCGGRNVCPKSWDVTTSLANLPLKRTYTSRPEGEITMIGLSMYFSPPFIVTGALHVSPPSCDVNSWTPGSYWSMKAT